MDDTVSHSSLGTHADPGEPQLHLQNRMSFQNLVSQQQKTWVHNQLGDWYEGGGRGEDPAPAVSFWIRISTRGWTAQIRRGGRADVARARRPGVSLAAASRIHPPLPSLP
jgi:hypothetical protein